MSKETNYIDAVTKLKDFINEQDVFIEKLIATNNELINALDRAATVFAHYEMHHAEKGALDKSTANGEYKQMCLDAIGKASGNV